jgi:hypothetical protein
MGSLYKGKIAKDLMILTIPLFLTWQLNKPSDIDPLVIPAKAGIQ